MTTGSITRGFRYLVNPSVPAKGYHLIGYFTKTWSGQDSPIPKRNYVNVRWRSPLSGPQTKLVLVQSPEGPIWVEIPVRDLQSLIKELRSKFFRNNPYESNVTIRTDKPFRYAPFPSDPNYLVGPQSSVSIIGGPIFSAPFYDLNIEPNWDINLIGKLREELVGSDFNVAVTAAESFEALRMLMSSARKIRVAYKLARKGRLKKAADVLWKDRDEERPTQNVASNWLQLQYGWLPLVLDAQAAAIYLAEYALRPRERVVKVRMRQPIAISGSGGAIWTGIAFKRYQMTAQVKESSEAALLGLQDPLSVAWEKLPYSFVIDWFIPIGNYLHARALSKAITGNFTKTVSLHADVLCTRIDGVYTEGLYQSYFQKRMRRTIHTTIAVPPVRFKPLSEVPSYLRCANAVALLVNLKR